MSAFPPFNPDGNCPKCDSFDIGIRFDREIAFGFACTWGDYAHSGKEHLHRTCRRCGYDWIEASLPPADTTNV